jgi:hypothetical protein
MNNKFFKISAWMLFIFSLAIFSFAAGFFLNSYISNRPLNPFAQNLIEDKPDSLFTIQNAVIQGKITAVDGRNLQVQNKNGAEGKLTAANTILIYKIPGTGTFATPSADLKEIDTTREATIGVSALGNNFEVTSIHYFDTPTTSNLPPLQIPSTPPSSRSATTPLIP